jgi:RNA polymerase sigma-70 factor, ECF subfamily
MQQPSAATSTLRAAAGAALQGRPQRDEQLRQCLHSCAGGDAAAFEAFYDATIAYARALGRRLLRDSELEDVLADAYFQAWREAARFDAARGSAVSWLLTIVRSRAIDLLRQRRAALPDESGEGPASDAPGPDDLLALAQAGSRLHAALVLLSADERWVLGLAYFRDLTHSAIATSTGMPLGTVKSLLSRSQDKLRALLANASPPSSSPSS